MAKKISYLDRLFNQIDKRIENSKTLEEEMKWEFFKSGICAALAANIMDNKK